MSHKTRVALLDTAERLFAERGFYGVSIANIADPLGLTKQALLHHFGSKEKLYGAVLKRISDDYTAQLMSLQNQAETPAFQAYMLSLADPNPQDTLRTQLIMRELLDNKNRAQMAQNWYLKPYLERLIEMLKTVPTWQERSDAEALALIYQLLGALHYFTISHPTLIGIFGVDRHQALSAVFPRQLKRLIETTLESASTPPTTSV